MNRERRNGLLLVLLGCALFVFRGIAWERVSPVSMIDFKGVYYDTRCLLHNCDPYNEAELSRFYTMDGGDQPGEPAGLRRVVTLNVYLPTTSILTAPFAMLPWDSARHLWMAVTAACFILAALLTWNLGSRYAPLTSGALICLLLATSELLLEIGNTAGLVIALCVIAVWCIVSERFVWVGVLCLAFSLLVKPHDSGLVWLYFLLAGGTYRKRALQVLAVTVLLGLPTVLWVSHIAPHWPRELHANLQTITSNGNANDPSPDNVTPWLHGASIVSLQSAIDVFRNDPHFYSVVTYLICAPLLILWAVRAWRSRSSSADTWLALAAIAPLSMLPIYHRQHDTRLLLLIVPACALLWAHGGRLKWPALWVTSAAILLTGDLPLQLLGILAHSLHANTITMPGRILTVLLARPAPIAMLAASIFFLIVYVRGLPAHAAAPEPPGASSIPRAASA